MSRPRLIPIVTTLAGLALAAGCGSTPPAEAPAPGGLWAHSPPVCGVDEVREYHCEELLPRSHALPAPAPYDSCPVSIESHAGVHGAAPPVALFDVDFTEHTRRRMPPGHSCCYSWCTGVKVAAPSQVPPRARCDGEHQLHETYCVDEPEGGTSEPMARPFDRCPAAVTPPEAAVFSVPAAAPFDVNGTVARRQAGFRECCYAWCSKAPAAPVIVKRPASSAGPTLGPQAASAH